LGELLGELFWLEFYQSLIRITS